MSAFISWYIVITILGWLTFPLAYFLFPALTDRGYALSRAFGLLIWGYIFWLVASLGIAQNDVRGLVLALFVFVGFTGLAAVADHRPLTTDHEHEMVDRQWSIVEWLKDN